LSDESTTSTSLATAESATPAVQGKVTFLLLCARAGVNRRMANALRVTLKRKRRDVNALCDEEKFRAALASLRPARG
jgi:hypothetical protein